MSRQADDFKKSIVFRTLQWSFGRLSFTPQELFDGLGISFSGTLDTTEERNEEIIFLKNNLNYAAYYTEQGKQTGNEIIFTTFDSTKHPRTRVDARYLLNVEATFKYIDFLELEQARENAEQARKYARWSIGIALGAIIVSAFGVVLEFISRHSSESWNPAMIQEFPLQLDPAINAG